MGREKLLDLIAYVRHWYAIQDSEGDWSFAPSKFVGYVGMTGERYDPQTLDGRDTEAVLRTWFCEVQEGSVLEESLRKQLQKATARYGKKLNSIARLHVLRSVVGTGSIKPVLREMQDWRITSDADILGGKPCIRGMRIRVADILDMLAGGASREEILVNFPYLEDADITAALEYAKGAVDHRLIKAA